MKVLFFLFLGILWIQGHPIDNAPIDVATRSMAPRDMGVSTHEDHDKLWFVVNWSKVENVDKTDPILGYKVKIWKVKKVKSTVYASNADGKFVPMEVEALPELDLQKDPSDELTVIDVPADKTEVTYHGMKKKVTYEIAVYAYTAKNKGTSSNKMRIEVEPDKGD
ncbi:unnamed protein product [Arctia plantaginis]|uniref:Fibronectin type-III domain-containing protein n=1 Tax=Arctia plantaginis TaxID=874455 RepID=A0A8S1A7V6_ARCPL|nr:unnamed protein product [Arctia plantaginis]